MQEIDFIFSIAILIMSVVIHEVSHGYAAFLLGDSTAKYAGRLTLNPLRHLDLLGSFIVPLISYLFGGFIFGWAKPVPYNPYNLRNPKKESALVAAAGPGSNLLTALFFGLLIRFGIAYSFLPQPFFNVLSTIVFINIILAVFNLIPIPPLDGSKILFAVLPYRWSFVQDFLESFGLVILLLAFAFFSEFVGPIASIIFRAIIGV